MNLFLYLVFLGLTGTYILFNNVANIFIVIQTPFDLFIIPGLLYYARYKEVIEKSGGEKEYFLEYKSQILVSEAISTQQTTHEVDFESISNTLMHATTKR